MILFNSIPVTNYYSLSYLLSPWLFLYHSHFYFYFYSYLHTNYYSYFNFHIPYLSIFTVSISIFYLPHLLCFEKVALSLEVKDNTPTPLGPCSTIFISYKYILQSWAPCEERGRERGEEDENKEEKDEIEKMMSKNILKVIIRKSLKSLARTHALSPLTCSHCPSISTEFNIWDPLLRVIMFGQLEHWQGGSVSGRVDTDHATLCFLPSTYSPSKAHS